MNQRRLPINPAIASTRRRGGGAGEPAAHRVPPPDPTWLIPGSSPWLVDSKDVARLLGIGRTKTFQMMAAGDLPTIRIGRSVRVPLAALQSWIDRQIADTEINDRRLLLGYVRARRQP